MDTSGTRDDETDVSQRTYKMRKVWGAGLFCDWPTDIAAKPSHFYRRVSRKNVSVLTHGPHKILREFQGAKQFPCTQRLRLETPGWQVLDFKGNSPSNAELERQPDRILRSLLVVRDREYHFPEVKLWLWTSLAL